jgi:2-polyprenyl-6-methoxyphenol hydroxylase-like FAD-dependent oxidoreductase
MKILISGAGIAGLTLAKRLHMTGHQPFVVEKATTFRQVGSMVELNQDAIAVLEKMNILDEIVEKSIQLGKRKFLDEKGDLLHELHLEMLRGSVLEHILIHRFTWHDVLYQSVKDQVPIQFGSYIKSLVEDETGIFATFQNGDQQRFDLFIGADGVHSITRKIIFGEQYKTNYQIGFMVFTIKDPLSKHIPSNLELGVNYATYLPGFYIQFGFDEHVASGLCMYQKEQNHFLSPLEKKPFLLERCEQLDWGMKEVIAQIEDSYLYEDDMNIVTLPKWSKGRTVWVGDAAHAMTFMLGTGGGKAMLGADRLVEALENTDTYQEAFRKYEFIHRPEVEKLQKKSVKAAIYTVANEIEEFQQKKMLLRKSPMKLLQKYSSE